MNCLKIRQNSRASGWKTFRNAADEGGDPLDAASLEPADRGLEDIAAGRVKSLEEYERERDL